MNSMTALQQAIFEDYGEQLTEQEAQRIVDLIKLLLQLDEEENTDAV